MARDRRRHLSAAEALETRRPMCRCAAPMARASSSSAATWWTRPTWSGCCEETWLRRFPPMGLGPLKSFVRLIRRVRARSCAPRRRLHAGRDPGRADHRGDRADGIDPGGRLAHHRAPATCAAAPWRNGVPRTACRRSGCSANIRRSGGATSTAARATCRCAARRTSSRPRIPVFAASRSRCSMPTCGAGRHRRHQHRRAAGPPDRLCHQPAMSVLTKSTRPPPQARRPRPRLHADRAAGRLRADGGACAAELARARFDPADARTPGSRLRRTALADACLLADGRRPAEVLAGRTC